MKAIFFKELYEGDEKPVKQVEQWNAWFFNKLDELPNVWDGWQKNNVRYFENSGSN